MKKKKTKEKKPKSGFALRLICAIIYLFAAVGLLLGSAYFYSQNHKNTFIEWFFNDYWSSNLKLSIRKAINSMWKAIGGISILIKTVKA